MDETGAHGGAPPDDFRGGFEPTDGTAPPLPGAGLPGLLSRLEELQRSVELLGSPGQWRDRPHPQPRAPAPSLPPHPPLRAPQQLPPPPEAPPHPPGSYEAPLWPTIAVVDAGPFNGLIQLRHFEEDLATLAAVRGVRVRRFGQGRANVEVVMAGPYALARELTRLGRPMELADGPGGELVVGLAPLTDSSPAQPGTAAFAASDRTAVDHPQTLDPTRSIEAHSTVTGIPVVSLDPDPSIATGDPVDATAARTLPAQVCRHFRMLPISYDGGTLVMAMANPNDGLAQNVAFALTSDPLEVVLAPAVQIDAAIDRVVAGLGLAPGLEEPVPAPLKNGTVVEPDSPVAPGRIGAILVARGLISEDDLAGALQIQERTGSRIGEILYYEGKVRERGLAEALADQLRVPLLDLDGLEPIAEVKGMIPEALQWKGRCLPLDVDDQALYVAITDPLDDETHEAIRELTDLQIRSYMATRSDLDGLLRRTHLDADVRAARTELLARLPEDCAGAPAFSRVRRVFSISLLLLILVSFVLAPLLTGIVLVVISVTISTLASLYRFKLFHDLAGRRQELDFTADEVAEIDDRDVPRYTIVVPLLREAAAVPQLTGNLARLDYPKAKLEIMLLCEEEDASTIDAIIEADLPPYFELLVVPGPQSKTKASSYGIQQATGRFVVILEAEDRPDPDQLKKALLAWERTEEGVVCVQCKLAHFNAEQSLLRRFLAPEYALWFELLRPRLDASGSPIPLNTANHFDRQALVELSA